MSEAFTPDALQKLRAEHGSLGRAAEALGISRSTLNRRWRAAGLPEIGKDGLTEAERSEKLTTGVEFASDADGPYATLTTRGNLRSIAVGDVEALLAERGLSIDEWEIVNLVVNEWDGPTKDGKQKLRQLKAHLRPRRVLDSLLRPAALPPITVAPGKPLVAASGDLGVLTGCWQYPYHDPTFEGLFEEFLADVRPAYGVDLGDGMDFPTISKYRDDPSINASPQACIDAFGLALYRRRHVSPDTAWTILLGNHDVRVIGEQLQRAERIAGLRPAVWPDEQPGEALLSLSRALRLDELGVAAVLPPNGSDKYAVAELALSDRMILVHGQKTDSSSAARDTVKQYGCSVAMAHTHRQRLFSVLLQRGPLAPVHATGVEVGCGMLIGGPGANYAKRPDWANGAMTVTLDEDGEPFFEPIRYREGVLRWRSYAWRA